MEQFVTSDFTLGIISGGQLGKMLVLAASNWDVRTYVLDHDTECPAAHACTEYFQGKSTNTQDVVDFGRRVDLLTFEIENVDVEALRILESEGKRIHPSPDIIETIQDKGLQKTFYSTHDIPTSEYQLFEDRAAIERAIAAGTLTYPFVQKLRTGGYDGRGVAVINSEEDSALLLEGASVVESLVPITKEVSIIVARNAAGQVVCYPAVDMEFNEDANLVERLVCPAPINEAAAQTARDLAEKLAEKLGLCGILAVEFFIDDDGSVLVNEVAPRTHNSGHHTIESIITSQFEQQLRAIFNFPLGSTQLKMPAVMVNLLGEPGSEGKVKYEGLNESMAIEGVKIHLYGKKISKPFRKMGHVTVLDSDIDRAREKADRVKQQLKVTSWPSQS